jgi:hypothetical protein
MKAFWVWISNLYNQNSAFHSLVMALEYAFASYVGATIDAWFANGTLNFPTSKAAWVAVAIGLAGALWAAFKRWMATNVATANLTMKK